MSDRHDTVWSTETSGQYDGPPSPVCRPRGEGSPRNGQTPGPRPYGPHGLSCPGGSRSPGGCVVGLTEVCGMPSGRHDGRATGRWTRARCTLALPRLFDPDCFVARAPWARGNPSEALFVWLGGVTFLPSLPVRYVRESEVKACAFTCRDSARASGTTKTGEKTYRRPGHRA